MQFGEEPQFCVRNRGRRGIRPAEACTECGGSIFQEALAAIQDDNTVPTASVSRTAAKARGKFNRDYTEFWKQVNAAAQIEVDAA